MEAPSTQTIQQLNTQIESVSITEALAILSAAFPGKTTFSSSFSFEDQLITHTILQSELPISIFTLDTGRLFAETYSVWNSTNTRYNTHIKAYYPDQSELESFVERNGPNSFYESVENRKSCCQIRKVEPLKRALAGNDVWITGLRAEHSAVRHGLQQLEWDAVNQVIKFHPLLFWTTDEVRSYIDQHNIPYNPLHDRGFVSIGCAPCTRAIKAGEDFRAGRWWWEDNSKKECGLHEQQHSQTN
ncbi:MAG: phosphoadenylyl-sulfate reductase [Sediminibacterium sp.]